LTVPTKIEFAQRRIREMRDITDLAAMLFPGNRNQQHAAARVLLFLKSAEEAVSTLSVLEGRHGISRRTLQRARAKLTRLGLIERISWMSARYAGGEGWRLSGRMSSSLRRLADWIDEWRKDRTPGRQEKDEQLAELLQ
jgi:hypothetical protein